MVRGSARNNRWMRRYRIFFVIGVLILFLQLFLAAKFFAINRNRKPEDNKWQPLNFESDLEQELESNSAGKSKLENVDDEDTLPSLRYKRNKHNNNQTHAILRYDELDFAPLCQITTKEATSAINRAKTQLCKQLISNITCLSYAGQLYPTELKGNCPSEGYVINKELGCFKDEKNYRLLNGYFGINNKHNSPKYCVKLCLQSGFPYAGVEYSNECYCGFDEPHLSSKMPDSSCNMKCPADPHATCGGYFAINIYQTGIKKFVPQTAITDIKNATITKPVKIVFLLTLNGRVLRQVRRLLKMLYHKEHYYYIHVDIRQDYLFRELLILEKQLPNVRLARKRFATIWGGASLLEMLRSSMWELINLQTWNWDFVLNLSESDFPVKTVKHLTNFLSLNKHRNFVKSHGREVQRFIQKQGLDKTFVECETRMWRIGDRHLPSGIQVDGGSDWVALSRKFVQYVSDPAPDDLISGLLRLFKYTLLPAESFFHTALRNSKFCNTYVDNNLHVTNWKRKLGCKCQYKHVVDWCGCSPNDFRPEDWPRILNTFTRQLFFARKFEPIINQAVILQVELWLHNLEQPSKFVENLHGYWQNIYHYRDLDGVRLDDGLLSIAESVQRQLLLRKFNNATKCARILSNLTEIHSFHYNDTYKYTLFKFDLIEIALAPQNRINISKNSLLMEHLDVLIVSSDYDQKEQISRNFLRVLSPQSEPVLVYKFKSKHYYYTSSSKVYNLTSLWVGPNGNVYDAVDFSVEETSLAGHVKPALKIPVLPGTWTVKLIYKTSILAEVKFLIIPLTYLSGTPLKPHQTVVVNGGSKSAREINSKSNLFEKFIPDEKLRENLKRKAIENAKKTGNDLQQWIDELVFQFYSIRGTCISNNSVVTSVCGNSAGEVDICEITNWSSFAPDPKSAIGALNETTGGFNIW